MGDVSDLRKLIGSRSVIGCCRWRKVGFRQREGEDDIEDGDERKLEVWMLLKLSLCCSFMG